MKSRSTKATRRRRGSVIIWGTRGHTITLISLVKSTFRTIRWVVSCAVLLVLVHVRSIVRAGVVWVAVGVVSNLGLLLVTGLLGWRTLSGSWLLSLSNWVRSSVATGLSLSSSGVT